MTTQIHVNNKMYILMLRKNEYYKLDKYVLFKKKKNVYIFLETRDYNR